MQVCTTIVKGGSKRTMNEKLTAGSAKNEMANTEKHEATIFPGQVRGTVSPYPMVVTVI